MTKRLLYPIDRLSIVLIVLLSFIIGLLIWGGSACETNYCLFQTGPRVREFSWQNQEVGAEDTAFILTFNRPMDQVSVEENLLIDPPIPGKVSWAGRRMAYTLKTPAPYGTKFQFQLAGARERFPDEESPGKLMQPFSSYFSSRDRAFAYIGVKGEETGRLIVYNLTEQKKTILTPFNLVVTAFEPYPKSDRILFLASDRNSWNQGLQEEKLYTVTTAINDPSTAPKVEQILDNERYRNLKFDLAQDGKTIVVQRLNREDPADFGLWVLEGKEAKPLNNPPGGDFLIAPDSNTIALSQGEGISLLALDKESDSLDFLPSFAEVLSFSQDGTAAAMVNFNTDNANLRYTRSLYLVTNQDVQEKLLDTNGSILDCQFNPSATTLYCIVTELQEKEEYREVPYLAAIDLKKGKVLPLALLPEQIDVKMSLSPDGLALLFDQIISDRNTSSMKAMRGNSGEAIASSRLWIVPLPPFNLPNPKETEIQELPLPGFRPQWLP